ncbi:MAG TPA: MerR family transcriptional regulator [Acidimicrobiales bacterium]|nr:MerR family transcriptional regulator [Acidimicrobiales bacterium]
MGERAYLSIGEVLSLLKDEFSDITISKIRFLESQGLLDPERTPSGYRKFYEADVDRLRWILRQQREHFLPLKVIKGRLGSDDPEPEVAPSAVAIAERAERAERTERAERVPIDPTPAPAPAPAAYVPPRQPPVSAGGNLTMDELATAAGLTHSQIRELEGFQLLGGRPVGGTTYYDDDALAVARLAAGFLRFGVEARHLRAYKSAAEREAGQFEQVVLPLLKQRNPQARQQAADTLSELSKLAQGLRATLLRQSLKDLTGT